MDELNATAGTAAGKYRVLTELGSGGMARVYLAVSQGLAGFSKLVVLKVLKSDLAGTAELQEGFLREARLCARMNHPNVVAVNEVEVLDGLPVIVMEHLQGQPFSAILRRVLGKVPVDSLLRILVDSLSGLHYAHELTDFDGAPLRLVHRDFSPQNVFVTYEGSVKVLDFGVAQATRNAEHVESDTVQGKLRYMAPEQVNGAPLDRRTDVFAAGVLFCELISGRRFWGDRSDAAIMSQLKSGEIPSPRSLLPSFPPELERIGTKALAYVRENRYQTVAAMQRDIEAYMTAHSMRVTTQEIGRQIAEWFGEERVQAQHLIESHLSNDTYVSWSRITTTLPGDFASKTPPLATATLTVRDLPRGSSSAVDAAPAKTRRWAKRTGIPLGLLLLAASALWLLPSKAAPPPIALASLPVNAPTEMRNVTIRVTAFPATATIAIDDIASVENPYVRTVAPDDGWHELRVEAVGHKTSTQQIQFQGDLELVVALEPEPPVEEPQQRKGSAAGKRGQATGHAQSPTRDPKLSCTPPYTYDSRGVKHFKPECL